MTFDRKKTMHSRVHCSLLCHSSSHISEVNKYGYARGNKVTSTTETLLSHPSTRMRAREWTSRNYAIHTPQQQQPPTTTVAINVLWTIRTHVTYPLTVERLSVKCSFCACVHERALDFGDVKLISVAFAAIVFRSYLHVSPWPWWRKQWSFYFL